MQSPTWALFNRHLAGASRGFRMGCKQASGTEAQPSCAMQHAASAAAVGKSNAAAPGSWMPNDLPMHTRGHEHFVANENISMPTSVRPCELPAYREQPVQLITQLQGAQGIQASLRQRHVSCHVSA